MNNETDEPNEWSEDSIHDIRQRGPRQRGRCLGVEARAVMSPNQRSSGGATLLVGKSGNVLAEFASCLH